MATQAHRDPLMTALAVIPDLPLSHLVLFVEAAIERLDEADGDPDLEPDPDSEEGGDMEAGEWLELDWECSPLAIGQRR